MVFTPCKAEQPLPGIELQEKEAQKIYTAYRKYIWKESAVNKCLILDIKPFRSYIKAKHSMGREFQSVAVQQEKLLT